MSQSGIVFVVGAGASAELGLPVGSKLRELIIESLHFEHDGASLLQGDSAIFTAIGELCRRSTANSRQTEYEEYKKAALHISRAIGLSESIDRFMHAQRGNSYVEKVGKLAIASNILRAEAKSRLYVEDTIDYRPFDLGSIGNTWYNRLFMLLFSKLTLEEARAAISKYSFVVFNYDRCLERFLGLALMEYYQLKSEEASKMVSEIKIYHPYGAVGNLGGNAEPHPVNFGEEPRRADLIRLSEGIRTFTEGIDPESGELFEVSKKIGEAEKLVFLGFGYDDLNMELLKIERGGRGNPSVPRCLGTSLGMSQQNAEVVVSNLKKMYYKSNPVLQPCSCCEFFDMYWKVLGG